MAYLSGLPDFLPPFSIIIGSPLLERSEKVYRENKSGSYAAKGENNVTRTKVIIIKKKKGTSAFATMGKKYLEHAGDCFGPAINRPPFFPSGFAVHYSSVFSRPSPPFYSAGIVFVYPE